jgi:hypothetical protein
MMRPLLLGVAVAALMAQPIDAQQPDTNSANYLLPACKNFLATGDSRPTTSAFYQGVCVGAVDTLHLLIRILPETPFRSCPPNQVTTGQELRVIIAYIEARPQRSSLTCAWRLETSRQSSSRVPPVSASL